jgi:hypothetical protein
VGWVEVRHAKLAGTDSRFLLHVPAYEQETHGLGEWNDLPRVPRRVFFWGTIACIVAAMALGIWPDMIAFFGPLAIVLLSGTRFAIVGTALGFVGARFTYMSPAGLITRRDDEGAVGGRIQVVDGGYFENSGTTTLLNLLRHLRRTFGCDIDAARPGCDLHVIHISNDALVPGMTDIDHCENGVSTSRMSPEVLAPIAALMATRGSRGETARKTLILDEDRRGRTLDALGKHVDETGEGGVARKFFHFRLCHDRAHHRIPLGWTLSPLSWNEMDDQLAGLRGEEHAEANQRQREAIVARLEVHALAQARRARLLP